MHMIGKNLLFKPHLKMVVRETTVEKALLVVNTGMSDKHTTEGLI